LQIDTADPVAMEQALRRYNGKAMINSVNGKKESMDAVFPLVKKYGGVVVALTLDESGIPETAEGRVEIAKKIFADGVHVGQMDMETDNVRKIIGGDKILGVSAQTVEQAVLAEKNGADYIGVGAVFSTISKDDAALVSHDMLANICENVSIPVVAIGGINENNIMQLEKTGICGVAVISAIYSAKDVKKATVALRNLAEKVVKHD
jgi:thiamine-phosphate pyrophosphorylase